MSVARPGRASAWAVLTAAVAATLLLVWALPGGPGRATATAGGTGASHLYLVPAGAAADRAVASPAVRLVARYEDAVLAETSAPDAGALVDAGAQIRDDLRRVTLQRRTVDPAAEQAATTTKRAPSPLAAADGPVLQVVQYVGPPKDGWLEDLAATGVRIVSYLPQAAYLVHAEGRQRDALAAYAERSSVVRATFPLAAADKIAPEIPAQGASPVAVQTLTGEDGTPARSALARAAGATTPRPDIHLGPYLTRYATLTRTEVEELAAQPGVVSLEAAPIPELLDERQALLMWDPVAALGAAGTYLGLVDGYTGTDTFDFAIDVTDEGLDTGNAADIGHTDFRVGGSAANPSRVGRIVNARTTGPVEDGSDCGGHGTINAGIAAGFTANTTPATDVDAAGYRYSMGVAPRARINATRVFQCSGPWNAPNLSTVADTTYAAGTRIHTNSWGANSGGAYTPEAQLFDRIVRDAQPGTAGNQQLVEVFSAGNSGPNPGTIGSPGTAKNVLTVGATESERPFGTDACGITDALADDNRQVIGFSSRGPTADGRLKPDVTAPGTHVSGTRSQSGAYNGNGVCGVAGGGIQFNNRYTASSGTSHSAPAVAGLAALVRDVFTPVIGRAPTPALTKALIANATVDIDDPAAGGHAPNTSQGHGTAAIRATLDQAATAAIRTGTFADSGTTQTIVRTVQDPGRPVRVALAFTDAPGSTVGSSVVNDLDLEVTAGGQVYRGNARDGATGLSLPGGTADPRNTLETVVLPAGTTGTYAVTVRATTIAGDGVPGDGDLTDQDYELVVDNQTAATAGYVTGDATTLRDEDGDGVIEPGEPFAAETTVTNVGGSPAQNVRSQISPASPDVTVTEPRGPAIELAPGATGTLAGARGVLASSAPCGTGARIGVALATDAPSGAGIGPGGRIAGPASVAFLRTAPTAVAIPDGPGGASATLPLVVSRPGRVANLEVILDLTHTYVGDLAITLTSPAGTTVTLMSRPGPGGAGSPGDDLVATILDDDATRTIESIVAADAPHTGRWRPDQPLAAFDGQTITGTWTLTVRDLAAGDTGTIQRVGISDPPDCNVDPVPAFDAPTTALVDETVTLDASPAVDRDGSLTRFEWDLDGDGTFERDNGTARTQTVAFPTVGAKPVALRVTDDRGARRTRSATITVGTPPPAPPAPTPTPSATPAPQPTPTTGQGLPTGERPAKVVPSLLGGPSTKRCLSRRTVRVTLKAPKGTTLRSVVVTVNGTRRRTVTGTGLRRAISLAGLPKGRVVVKVLATTTTGARLTASRTYRTCTPKKRR
ncbi:S8 family serine peptidase [Paraconexibacter algicola]|uniref:P/Homo B domain-containing protein n=1 Tax=Paraconexibacter algicola TaxID=2133960 RepID=A0A2T4UHB3_9ACTN|nr:S8 family serine peptidase [Paraconexibacter algicola]PTL58636.1 hypothetical protein C7Y72_02690 [Paraconexibacter algicola]